MKCGTFLHARYPNRRTRYVTACTNHRLCLPGEIMARKIVNDSMPGNSTGVPGDPAQDDFFSEAELLGFKPEGTEQATAIGSCKCHALVCLYPFNQ